MKNAAPKDGILLNRCSFCRRAYWNSGNKLSCASGNALPFANWQFCVEPEPLTSCHVLTLPPLLAQSAAFPLPPEAMPVSAGAGGGGAY